MTAIGVRVALDDPTVADVNKWQAEIRPASVHIQHNPFDTVTIGNPGNPHPGGAIRPEDLEKNVLEQLGSTPLKFSH